MSATIFNYRLQRGSKEDLLKARERLMVSDPLIRLPHNPFASGYLSCTMDEPAIYVGLGAYDKLARFPGEIIAFDTGYTQHIEANNGKV